MLKDQPSGLHHIEPFYGWLAWYSHDQDERSPFHEVEHNQFYYDRSINQIPAHPLWDDFGSESLLCKILFADYEKGFAIIELFGEWNDLFDNDFKLFAENCLTYLVDHGIDRFVLICENVFHIYLDQTDYYDAMLDELGESGWMCLLRTRQQVKEDLDEYGVSAFFYQSERLDQIPWRRLKPAQLFALIESRMPKLLD